MLKKLSIGQKLGGGFAVMALMLISVVIISLTQLSRLYTDTSELSGNMLPSVVSSGKINAYLLDARRMELAALLALSHGDEAGYEENIKQFQAHHDIFEKEFEYYRTIPFLNQDEQTTYNKLGMSLQRYYQIHDDIEEAVRQKDMARVISLRDNESRTVLLEWI